MAKSNTRDLESQVPIAKARNPKALSSYLQMSPRALPPPKNIFVWAIILLFAIGGMVALPHHDIREELTVDDISLVAIAVAMGANVAAALFGAATCYVYENVAPRSEGATAQWRELGIRVGMAMLYSVSLVLVLLSGGSFLLFAIRVGWMSNPMAFFITVVRGPVALLLILYICLA